MFKRIRKYIIVWSTLLLALFTAYYAVVAIYTHVHIINGVMVVHSHPFHGEHTHTEGQLLVLNFLSHFYSDEAGDTVSFTIPVRPLLYTLDDGYEESSSLADFSDGIYWRGPPGIFCI